MIILVVQVPYLKNLVVKQRLQGDVALRMPSKIIDCLIAAFNFDEFELFTVNDFRRVNGEDAKSVKALTDIFMKH